MLSRQALLRSVRHAAPSRAILSQTRSFASPASIDKVKPPMAVFEKVKPPVAVYGVDGTYATALVQILFNSVPSIGCIPILRPFHTSRSCN